MARFTHALQAALASAALILCGAAASAEQLQAGPEAPMAFFAPAPAEETPLSHMRGIITSYAIGDRYGEVDIKDADGRIWKMLIGGDMKVLGMERTCMEAPYGMDEPNVAQCPDWPQRIVLGKTVITVTFWEATIGVKPVLVASRIEMAKGGLQL